MAGDSCARRVIHPAPGSGLDCQSVLAFPALLDTPLVGRHLRGVDEKAYEGLRHIRSGQGPYPRPVARHLPCRASFPAILALDCYAASRGSRATDTTIQHFAPSPA